MNKYTIIYDYKGGSYIYQTKAISQEEATLKFMKSSDFKKYIGKETTHYLKELKMFYLPLLKIKRRQHIWTFSLRVGKILVDFLVVKTCEK